MNEASDGSRGNGIGLGVLRAAAADAPGHAGVYLFLDGHGDVLYVGKAGNLRQRLRQHAAVDAPSRGLYRRYDLVRRVVWEPAAGDEAAFWREADLIFALSPPFNGNPGLRAKDPAGTDVQVPYIVVADAAPGRLRFTLQPAAPESGRVYGCFPHLGKGVSSRIGIACSDGYTALLRLLWAAESPDAHTPASITRSAPPVFTVPVSAGLRDGLHRFLSGARARFAEELLSAAAHRPEFMQPALLRDKQAALEFFNAGPRLVRARRLRHHIRGGVLDAQTYRDLVGEEIAPVMS